MTSVDAYQGITLYSRDVSSRASEKDEVLTDNNDTSADLSQKARELKKKSWRWGKPFI
jgi:hypothetical protein